MNINFEYHDVSASNRLEILATKKLTKLEDKYDFIVNADVYLKKENTSNSNSGMICSIRLNTSGHTLFSEASTGSFEASIAKATTELKSQLEKRKAKMQ